MSNWMPISSAPRTGKRILLFAAIFGTPGKIVTGRYSVDAYRTMDDVVIGAEEGFQSDGDECIPSNQEVFTHWRPLPDPPCSSVETGRGLDMSDQPMGDPHPIDLVLNGQCPMCGEHEVFTRAGMKTTHVCSTVNR